MAWRMSSGSKPAVTSGLPYSWVTNRYGWLPDHGRHVARPEEPVEPEVGRVEDRLDGRHDRDVVREHAEVHDRGRRAPSPA